MQFNKNSSINKVKVIMICLVIMLAGLYMTHNPTHYLYFVYSALITLLLNFIYIPRISIFIKFFVGLFVLGNWLKITLHGVIDYPYVEATGYFSGSSSQWDEYYLYSIVISLGILSASLLQYIISPAKSIAPRSHVKINKGNISYSLLLIPIFLIYALNWLFGFYRIGVARDLDLPLGLNAPASFLVYLGAPMLLAFYASLNVRKFGEVTVRALIVVAFISIIAAITTYSRATLFMLALPILLGMYKIAHHVNGRPQSIVGLLIVMIPTTVLTLLFVSIVRIFVFKGAESIDGSSMEFYLYESLGLFVDRWIGAEGLMVAVSSPQSFDLFLKMLFEDPTIGVSGIYQFLAGSQYLNFNMDGMTFLTLPGFFALLSFSGNYFIVFLGITFSVLFGVLIDRIVFNIFPRTYTLHFLVAGSFAYHLSQMIFPRLLIPYLAQLILFIFVFKFFSLVLNKSKHANHRPLLVSQ